MKKIFGKHLKLYEGFGLLLLLSAWLVEWSSVRRWDDVEAKFLRFFTSFQETAYKYDAGSFVSLHFAMDRAVRDRTLDLDDPNSLLLGAWQSAEFRQQWLMSEINHFIAADTEIKGALKTSNDNGLNANLDADGLDRIREDTRLSLFKVAGVPPDSTMTHAIPPRALPITDVEEADRKFREFNGSVFGPINAVADAISAKRDRLSFQYRAVFALGSLILILVKVGEWTEARGRQLTPTLASGGQDHPARSLAPAKDPRPDAGL